MDRFAKAIHYNLWLGLNWFEQVFFPGARRISVTVRRQVMLAVLMLTVGVPVNLYIFYGASEKQAIAAEQHSMSEPMLLSEMDAGSNLGSEESGHADNLVDAPQQSAVEHAQSHSDPNYVCPMHPEIVTKDPEATCPICGMDLVPLENTGDADIVSLAPTVINALGVRLEKVKRRTMYRRIDSVGYITYNDNNLRTVSLRTDGWIEKLVVKTVGERVKKGDLLFEVYSPKLVNAQEEYVQALELDRGDGMMIDASRERLRVLGVSDAQLNALRDSRDVQQRISIFAPQDGVITKLNTSEGEFVLPSKAIISIADLNNVWLMVDIFESQVDWVKEGQMAEAALPFMPEKIWEGEVEYVYPTLDPKTRSVKARLRFDNSDELLKPNMYADITIFAKPKRKVLTVPREAVIRQGNQTRVITHLGEGRFKPVIVHAGIESQDKIEIVGGLEEDQEVVVSSQFLIDSESSMRAALMRLAGG